MWTSPTPARSLSLRPTDIRSECRSCRLARSDDSRDGEAGTESVDFFRVSDIGERACCRRESGAGASACPFEPADASGLTSKLTSSRASASSAATKPCASPGERSRRSRVERPWWGVDRDSIAKAVTSRAQDCHRSRRTGTLVALVVS